MSKLDGNESGTKQNISIQLQHVSSLGPSRQRSMARAECACESLRINIETEYSLPKRELHHIVAKEDEGEVPYDLSDNMHAARRCHINKYEMFSRITCTGTRQTEFRTVRVHFGRLQPSLPSLPSWAACSINECNEHDCVIDQTDHECTNDHDFHVARPMHNTVSEFGRRHFCRR